MMRFVVITLAFMLCSCLYAAEVSPEQQIEQRIKPVGSVHVAEDSKAHASPAKEEAGRATYERYCTVCHRDGLVGAPKFRDEQAWKSRLKGKTLEDLVASAIKGLNAMPAKGTCYECNEADIKSAVEYMLPKS